MKNIGPLVIGFLCAMVALFVGFMASPNRRISAILLVSLPLAGLPRSVRYCDVENGLCQVHRDRRTLAFGLLPSGNLRR